MMMEISDSYPSERDDLFTDAHKQWDWHDKAVRYEFPDGSAIIAGSIWGEKVVNALGFDQVTVSAEPEKMFVPMYLWGDGEEEGPEIQLARRRSDGRVDRLRMVEATTGLSQSENFRRGFHSHSPPRLHGKLRKGKRMTITKYVLVNKEGEQDSDVYDTYQEAVNEAMKYSPNFAIEELEFEYSDSDLAWTPHNDGIWPPGGPSIFEELEIVK